MSARPNVISAQDQFTPDKSLAHPVPQATEAEELFIAALLNAPAETLEFAQLERLKPEHFYLVRHQMIFEAVCELQREELPLELITITERLRAKGQLDEVGGAAQLTQVANRLELLDLGDAPRAAASVVREKAERRAWLGFASEIAKTAHADDKNIISQWSSLTRTWTGLRPFEPNQNFVYGEQSVAIYDAMLDDARRNAAWFPVPFPSLAERRGVILPGELVVVTGPEGVVDQVRRVLARCLHNL